MRDLLLGAIRSFEGPRDRELLWSCGRKGGAGGRAGTQLPRAAAAEQPPEDETVAQAERCGLTQGEYGGWRGGLGGGPERRSRFEGLA